MSASNPDILLLGGGYTLQKVAAALPQERVVITHSSAGKVAETRAKGYLSELVDLKDIVTLQEVLRRYSGIRYFVDSVPPLVGGPCDELVSQAVASFQAHGIQAGIYLSSTGVYGYTDGRKVFETTPLQPYSERGQRRVACENAYSQATFPVIRLRLSGIYSHDRGLRRALESGRYKLYPGRWSNRIHVDDIKRVIVSLLTERDPASWPKALNVTDSAPAPVEEVVKYYCSILDLPVPPLGTEEPGPESFYRSNQKVENKLLLDYLGDILAYPDYKVVAEQWK